MTSTYTYMEQLGIADTDSEGRQAIEDAVSLIRAKVIEKTPDRKKAALAMAKRILALESTEAEAIAEVAAAKA